MKKHHIILCVLLFASCNKHALPTFVYHNSSVIDTLSKRKQIIKQQIPFEFFDTTGIASKKNIAQGMRKDPLISASPITLPLLQWNDSAKQFIKGINTQYGNRINITFLCDGYLSTDSIKALSDIQTVIAGMKTRVPFSWYFNRISFYEVFARSKQSGVGQLASVCGPVVTPNNYFGSYMGLSGVCRWMNCNQTTVNNVLAGTMPYTDVPVVICNTSVYGGAADGSTAIITTDSYSSEVFIHECGHALFGLGDEYAYGGCGYPANYNSLSTNDTALARKLWGDTWVTWLKGCGLYIGADYCPSGLRDSSECEMKDLIQPFCPQCKKRGIYSMNYFTSNIDGFYPSSTATTTDKFFVNLLQPTANTIKIVWSVNGSVIKNVARAYTPPNGTYQNVKVETYDTSVWLFNTQAPHYSQSWSNITVSNKITTPPPVELTAPIIDSVKTLFNKTTVLIYWRNIKGATKTKVLRRSMTSTTQNFNVWTNLLLTTFFTSGVPRNTSWQVQVADIDAKGNTIFSNIVTFKGGTGLTYKTK